MNGKFGHDKYIGDFTCDNTSGKSTVNYTIMSACLLPNVKDFVIEVFDPCLSDKHKAFYTVMNYNGLVNVDTVPMNEYVKPNNQNPLISCIKSRWDSSKTNDYSSGFDPTYIDSINVKLDNFSKSNPDCRSCSTTFVPISLIYLLTLLSKWVFLIKL